MQNLKLLKEIKYQSTEKQRLINFAQNNFKDFIPSNKGIKKAIKRGLIKLNNKQVKDGVFLKNGDIISLYISESNKVIDLGIDIEILYEDEHLAVINKPAGIVVSGNKRKTIVNILQGILNKSSEKDQLAIPYPVHRLDKATSGLLIVAKTRTAQIKLGQMLENKQIKKIYYAIVQGNTPDEFTIDKSIDDKNAETVFTKQKTVESKHYEHLTLLKVNLKTGRKHQIRIHSAYAGYPIVGDNSNTDYIKKGLFLSACELHLPHPVFKEKNIDIEIPLPNKFLRLMKLKNIEKTQ